MNIQTYKHTNIQTYKHTNIEYFQFKIVNVHNVHNVNCLLSTNIGD